MNKYEGPEQDRQVDVVCRSAFAAAQDALRDAGKGAKFVLRNTGIADDDIHCVAGFYDNTTNERTEVVVEWTPDASLLRERFSLGALEAYEVEASARHESARHVHRGSVGGEVEEADPNAGKDAAAVARGRRGGVKGAASRAKALTSAARTAIAPRAAIA